MTVYEFGLTIEGNVDEKIEDLFVAGCDDATFGWRAGQYYAYFHRSAPTRNMAISSAIRDIESVGLRVRW